MEESSVYALMYDVALNCEVQVAAWPTAVENMADMTDFGISMMSEYVRRDYEEYGYTVDCVELYSVAGGHKFIRTIASCSGEAGLEYMVEYLTYHGGYEV